MVQRCQVVVHIFGYSKNNAVRLTCSVVKANEQSWEDKQKT